MTTAGLIIIGDEILNGSVTDTNSTFLCKRFHACGIQVRRISTVPDDVTVISEEVVKFSKTFDIVLTTGGVGPTHDDVTYESMAIAFNTSLRTDLTLKSFYSWYLKDQDDFATRLITIPSNAQVIMVDLEEPLEGPLPRFPVIKTFNVYNFPGVPSYTKAIFTAMEDKYFRNSKNIFFSRSIYFNVDEIFVLPILNEVIAEFRQHVTFGSYPLLDGHKERDEMAKIRLESTSLSQCLDAEKKLLSKIPFQWIVHIQPRLPNLDVIHQLPMYDCELSIALKKSLQLIEECFTKYDVSETFISFNGGKDCTVLFNLIYYCSLKKNFAKQLKLVYFKEPDSFPEVDLFINDVKNSYGVELLVLPAPIKKSLQEFLSKDPSKKIAFLGVRNNDPKSKDLKPIQETDSDWPKVIRMCPLLHWSYKNVWDFIRSANVPYCSLYDQGYTSLGCKSNTSVNAALKIVNKDKIYYKPAFLLPEGKNERDGRYFH